MKSPQGFVWVSFAWNDDHGHFSGELFSIEIDDEITLELSPFEGADIELLQGQSEVEAQNCFKLGGELFFYPEVHRWLGSIVWDGLLLKEEDALRLMKLAPKVGFTCFEYAIDSPYWKAFEQGEKEHEQARKICGSKKADSDHADHS